MFNQKIYLMKNLKLNQLKNQEMNAVQGGLPGQDAAAWLDAPVTADPCTASCDGYAAYEYYRDNFESRLHGYGAH